MGGSNAQSISNPASSFAKVNQKDTIIRNCIAARALKLYEQTVHGSSSDATSVVSYILTLPPVLEARGMIFSFFCISAADGLTITIADAGDDMNFTDLVMDTTNDYAIVYSDGIYWHVLASLVA